MTGKNKNVVLFAVLCVLIYWIGRSSSAAYLESTTTLAKVGTVAPVFEMTTLTGEMVSNESTKGKVVVLVLFATWCGPCLDELPEIEREIWGHFRQNPGFEMVAVGWEHSKAELIQFQHAEGFTFPLAPDPDGSVFARFANEYVPRAFLIDREGRIAYTSMGYDPASVGILQGKIESALAKTPSPVAKAPQSVPAKQPE